MCYANKRFGCAVPFPANTMWLSGDQALRIQRTGFHNPAQDWQGRRPPHHAEELQGEHPLPGPQHARYSPADAAALAFATFLRRIALDYDAGAGQWGDADEITISGDDMQRGVLKLFLNRRG